MSFNITASRIIENSIMSSLYIDDKVVEPFELLNKANYEYHEVSKGLYSSFKAKNKSLDFYKFQLTKDWRQESDYIFKNRDLLILDWQLDDSKELRQSDTLEILQQAVETDSLHFVSIYTATEARHFPDIFYSIKAYFEHNFNESAKATYNKLIADIDAEGIDSAFIKEFGGIFKEIALKNDNKEILDDLKKRLQETLTDKYKILSQHLKSLNSKDTVKAYEILGYCINDEEINTNLNKNYDLNFRFINDNFVQVNHTIIQLTNKNRPQPSDYFDFFTSALLQVCGNPLTITSLEIKRLLRESSGFIGKDVDSINEAVLFHHKSKKENFFDFILDIWKSHTLSFVDYNAEKLQSLNDSFWDEYEVENKIKEKLSELKTQESSFHNELSKLNIYYNALHLLKVKTDIIKFGDIFVSVDANGKQIGKFWLNITAHCDCLAPKENIKNNFYFIAGEKSNLKESLSDGDGGYNSFLNTEAGIISIKWHPRPVVLNIPNNTMTDYVVKATDGVLKEHSLKYIGTLKENYAQRMANNSFSFAMRVGIDFASI